MVQNYVVGCCSTGNLSPFNGRGNAYRSVVGHRCSACLVGRQCFAVEIQHYVFAFGNIYRFGSVFKQCNGFTGTRSIYCCLQGNVTYSVVQSNVLAFNNRCVAFFIHRCRVQNTSVGKFRVLRSNSKFAVAYVVVHTFGNYTACKRTARNGNCGNRCRAGFVLYVGFVESLTVGVCSQVLEFATADVYSDLSLCRVLTDCNCSACYRGTATVRSFGKVGFCGNNSVRNVQCAVAKFNCAIVTDNFATVHIEGTNTGMIDCSRTYHLATVYSNFGRQCIGTVVTYCGCLGCCNY